MSHEKLKPVRDDVEMCEPIPPRWIGELSQLAIRAFHSESDLAPLGCHFHENDEVERPQWEVTLFVSSTEVIGGSLDGHRSVSPFMVDLAKLMSVLDVVESCYWQAHTMAEDDQLGPHVGMEGVFRGRSVWLRITAQPPDQFDPGRAFDSIASQLQNLW